MHVKIIGYLMIYLCDKSLGSALLALSSKEVTLQTGAIVQDDIQVGLRYYEKLLRSRTFLQYCILHEKVVFIPLCLVKSAKYYCFGSKVKKYLCTSNGICLSYTRATISIYPQDSVHHNFLRAGVLRKKAPRVICPYSPFYGVLPLA
jgi:hypothetical protein